MALLDLPSAVLEEIASLVPGGPRRALRAASCELRAAANAGTRSMAVSASEVCRHAGTASLAQACSPSLCASPCLNVSSWQVPIALMSLLLELQLPWGSASSKQQAAHALLLSCLLISPRCPLKQANGAAADNTAAPA